MPAQPVDAGDRDGAIGGDILPAIGERAGEIGGADIVADETAGLEHVGASAAEAVDAEIGAAAGERKTRQRIRRDPEVRAGGKTERARGGVVRSEHRGSPLVLAAAAIGRAPQAPAADRTHRCARPRPWSGIWQRHRARRRIFSRHRPSTRSSANGVAPAVPPRPPPRPSMKGSVSNPRNRFIAVKVACWVPVAVSPEICDRPLGERPAKAAGMLPLVLKKFVSALFTFCWLMLSLYLRA